MHYQSIWQMCFMFRNNFAHLLANKLLGRVTLLKHGGLSDLHRNVSQTLMCKYKFNVFHHHRHFNACLFKCCDGNLIIAGSKDFTEELAPDGPSH